MAQITREILSAELERYEALVADWKEQLAAAQGAIAATKRLIAIMDEPDGVTLDQLKDMIGADSIEAPKPIGEVGGE